MMPSKSNSIFMEPSRLSSSILGVTLNVSLMDDGRRLGSDLAGSGSVAAGESGGGSATWTSLDEAVVAGVAMVPLWEVVAPELCMFTRRRP